MRAAADLGLCFLASVFFFAGCKQSRRETTNDPAAPNTAGLEKWPKGIREIRYLSSGDQTLQPALFFAPPSGAPKPLLVALHTWSGDYLQADSRPYARWCAENGWAFIHPNFRGVNKQPEATGSDLVVADIASAVTYARQQTNVDPSRTYLVGVSGGGMASLLLAGRAPHIWAAVSSWVPIVDLRDWYFESVERKQSYATDIVRSCGGVPDRGTDAEREAKKRSPIVYLAAAGAIPVSINAGIHDGHDGAAVPVSHSLRAFNALADPADNLTDGQLAWITEKATIPPDLQAETFDDPSYGERKVLFRRRSRNVTLTVFEGGHEIVFGAALKWLAAQHR